MVRPEDITGFANNQWFTNLAGFGDWIGQILISILLLALFYGIYLFLEHKIKVTIFPLYGVRDEDVKEIGSMDDLAALPYSIEVGHPKKDRGREFKSKRVRKLSLLFSRRKIREVPYNLKYSDGIWMLRPTKDHFIPIPRPTLADAVNLKVPESDLDLWQESAEAEVRRRTQDEDTMKKHLYMTVAIILGAFALAALIIWLSMSFAGNNLNQVLTETSGLKDALTNFAAEKGPG